MSAARPVFAEHESRCGECDGKIRVGDSIAMSSRSPRAFWQHETCPPGKLDLTREICGECFTEKSVDGSCMCGAL